MDKKAQKGHGWVKRDAFSYVCNLTGCTKQYSEEETKIYPAKFYQLQQVKTIWIFKSAGIDGGLAVGDGIRWVLSALSSQKEIICVCIRAMGTSICVPNFNKKT